MSTPHLFDVKALRRQRNRHAASLMADPFLLELMIERLLERLGDIKRGFTDMLDLGGRHGLLARALERIDPVVRPVVLDPAERLCREAPGAGVVADLETLPFARESFDAVLSAGSLHHVNDLPGLLAQTRQCLRPDGLFLAVFAGGETLCELRRVLMSAELEETGGAGLRVAPFVDVRDLGALLQRTGFALPCVDSDRLTLTYADPWQLLGELRGAGEANVIRDRPRQPLRRAVLARAFEAYAREFTDRRGRLVVTVDLVTATGWAPHPDQQRPARRGSGSVNLAKAMGVDPDILAGKLSPPGRPPR
ncbi:MAG: methyltransferase domain-containing protein [Geminicoccaceae bacterium]|nr:MAG: methyltransferase domain-containing protein [Geminicoccaceae bacterium]